MEELEAKITELEGKLQMARESYKSQKTALDAANSRIKELEDELVLNGDAVDEVNNLKARLEKAKSIFNEQKGRIKTLEDTNNTLTATINALESDKASLTETVDRLNEEVNGYKAQLDRIREIVNL